MENFMEKQNFKNYPSPAQKLIENFEETGSVNSNDFRKNLDLYEEGSLPKEFFSILAGIESNGGHPKIALYNFEKFQGLSAQEAANRLIESKNQAFAVFDLEDYLEENTKALLEKENDLGKRKKDGYKDEDEIILKIKKEISILEKENKKINKVLTSLNKKELFDITKGIRDKLTCDRMDFFTRGSSRLEINYNKLISELIENDYSPGYLEDFIAKAPEKSLSKELKEKLEKIEDEQLQEKIENSLANRFVE